MAGSFFNSTEFEVIFYAFFSCFLIKNLSKSNFTERYSLTFWKKNKKISEKPFKNEVLFWGVFFS